MNSILNNTLKAATVFAITAWTAASFAGQFYVLDIDQQMSRRNGNDTVKLKQQLQQQYQVNTRNAELLSVMMVSKTKVGRGGATLIVGQNHSPSQTVAGSQISFHSDDETTYDRTLFTNPKSNSKGKWQIKLRGNFMVKQVVVEIDPNPTKKVSLNLNIHTRTGRGGNDTIYVRQIMKQQTSMIPKNYNIKSVTIVGKSKQGRGTASLLIGQALSAAETLGGNPVRFQRNGPRSFDTVTIQNPKRNSNGVWQIKLRGNIKIKKIILTLKKK